MAASARAGFSVKQISSKNVHQRGELLVSKDSVGRSTEAQIRERESLDKEIAHPFVCR